MMKEEIEKIIVEELGINDEVKTITHRVKSMIKTDAYERIKKLGDSLSSYHHITNTLQEKIRGKILTITYTCFIYNSPQEYNRTFSSIPLSQYNPDKNIIYANAWYILGEKVSLDEVSLQHEIHHMFQKSLPGGMLNTTDKKYRDAVEIMASKKAPAEYKIVARVIYMMSKPEIDAITNDFYRIAMENDNDIESVVNSSHFKNITTINDRLGTYLSNENLQWKLKKAFDYFEMDEYTFMRKVRELRKVYSRNAGRAIIKARYDKEKIIYDEGIINHSIDTEINELEKQLI